MAATVVAAVAVNPVAAAVASLVAAAVASPVAAAVVVEAEDLEEAFKCRSYPLCPQFAFWVGSCRRLP